MLATEDDCSSQSNSENRDREVLMELSMHIAEKPDLAQNALKTLELL